MKPVRIAELMVEFSWLILHAIYHSILPSGCKDFSFLLFISQIFVKSLCLFVAECWYVVVYTKYSYHCSVTFCYEEHTCPTVGTDFVSHALLTAGSKKLSA